MKLHALKIEPEGLAGWTSEELFFGREITELYGPNGTGKTPLIQSIAYCLGYPVKFRDDVASKCAAAILTIENDAGLVTLRRKIGAQFDAQVTDATGTKTFYGDKEYSQYLLDFF